MDSVYKNERGVTFEVDTEHVRSPGAFAESVRTLFRRRRNPASLRKSTERPPGLGLIVGLASEPDDLVVEFWPHEEAVLAERVERWLNALE